ncbi:hypothetical protein [Candidatus Pelagibacter sp. FZCC0015]|uniref:hypothetical protein n=1 Tax=Candidatus Pelagibacter sp. FZCC0015 TaxID=2268451 RepID=UPI0011AB0DD7|nr:hypothetical protein [Candidatus Pelagibacter sp. FZCC0015]
MNYFFAFKNNILKSELQIPLFKNRSTRPSKLKLFRCYPKNNKWVLEDLSEKKINDYFYILNNDNISNSDVYFLGQDGLDINFKGEKLIDFNSFTNTQPEFRANLKIYIDEGGFSSYQSEYPYSMVVKKGTILSSVSSLANSEAEKNFIIIKNIFEKPIEQNFNAYLVNIRTKKIEEIFELKTNNANFIEINSKLIKPEIFLTTKEYLGIPMFVSIKNKFLSFEHTHPPHEYILSNDKYIKIKDLKKEINEISN